MAYFALDTTTPITLSVEEFLFDSVSSVFADFYTGAYRPKFTLQSIRGANWKNLKLE